MKHPSLVVVLLLTVAGRALGAVVDEVGLLSSQQIQDLNALTSDGRVAIHLAASTGGESLRVYADDWAAQHKAQQPQLAAAITVVPSSHQVYVSVAQEARERFTSVEAGQVVNSVLVPAFQRQDWSGGLTQAVQAIEAQLASTTTSVVVAPTPTPPPAASSAGFDAGPLLLVGLLVLLVAGTVWARWYARFRKFEAVVSDGRPDFPLVQDVRAQEEVRQALETLEDLQRALPQTFQKRVAFYGRQRQDYQRAYTTCLRAQQVWDLERQREAVAQARFESIRSRLDTLPATERERFVALEAEYQASGYNNALLLQNLVALDVMLHVLEPPGFGPSGLADDPARPDDWQAGTGGFGGDFGGGSDGGSDGGAGGSW